MADVRGRGPKSRVSSRASISGFVVPGPATHDVVPFRSNVYELEPWHVENGWPEPGAGAALPTSVYDITPPTYTLPDPEDVTTNADARWIGAGFSGGTWSPQQGSGTWTGTATAKASYKYTVYETSYDHPAVRFDQEENQYLTGDLTGYTGTNYAFVMAFKPYSAEDTEDEDGDETPAYGIFSPAVAATGQPSLRCRNDKLLVKQSSELAAKEAATHDPRSFGHYINRGAVSYLVWSVGPTRITYYIGAGPSSLRRHRIWDPHPSTAKVFNFRLGAYAEDEVHCADMLVFDLGFYNAGLTELQAAEEVALIAEAYGGE